MRPVTILASVSLQAYRQRLPLVAFILLLLICLLMLGFACACFSDQPMQALERALSIGQALPPLVVVWSLLALVLASTPVFLQRRFVASRASPALLQRFLF
jgi:hypothetical protein